MFQCGSVHCQKQWSVGVGAAAAAAGAGGAAAGGGATTSTVISGGTTSMVTGGGTTITGRGGAGRAQAQSATAARPRHLMPGATDVARAGSVRIASGAPGSGSERRELDAVGELVERLGIGGALGAEEDARGRRDLRSDLGDHRAEGRL